MIDLDAKAKEIIRDDPALADAIRRHLVDKPLPQFSLTPRQRALFDFIGQYIEKNDGLAPSYDEMSIHMGLVSKGGVNRLVKGLEERGAIRRLPNRTRAISIVEHAA